MKVLHEWLKEYIGESIPSSDEIEKLLTFHSFEIEGVLKEARHEVIDVDVLPNRSSDCLSHRGIAREIATLLGVTLAQDPFREEVVLTPSLASLTISIEDTEACPRFALALVEGVTIQESPKWLKERLEALGQRSINNVVDATNYVMLALGQPLHAYDADKLTHESGTWHFIVRMAHEGERVVTLTGETCELTPANQLIVDGTSDIPLGIAGIKGGKHAEIDESTKNIIIEAAHFDPSVTRRSSQRLRLQTDASKRFENEISREVVPFALVEVAGLILENAGGALLGYADSYPNKKKNTEVYVTLAHINALLGLSLDEHTVEDIFDRLGFTHTKNGDSFAVVAPFERTDITIPENVIEEIGRVYGYNHVESMVPVSAPLIEINARHYYSEKLRKALTDLGYSEVITSSFRKKDEIRLQNALASDKAYLRSSLRKNIGEVLLKNIPNADLLGLPDIRVFEIGTVFTKKGEKGIHEEMMVALGVRTKQQGYHEKDDVILTETVTQLSAILGQDVGAHIEKGIAEFSLSKLLEVLPKPASYEPYEKAKDVTFTPFSNYPFVTRDIALWVPLNSTPDEVEKTLNEEAGNLRVRTTLFDEFTKDGRVSYAFRLVFQSYEKTLTDDEVNTIMDRITASISKRGWETR